MSDYNRRIELLQRQLTAAEADFGLLAGTDHMQYLTGWKEGGHERFVGLFVPAHGEPGFVVPAMNARQAQTTPAAVKDVSGWQDETGWHVSAKDWIRRAGIGANFKALVDDELLSVHLLGLQSLYPAASFAPIGDTMAALREIKTEAELAEMQAAADLIDQIVEESLEILTEGMTELELQSWLLDAFSRFDTAPSFTPLCCFGANGAMPHHHTGTAKLKAGDIVIIDSGCKSAGYASDITRTVAFKHVGDDEANRVYDVVYRAHIAGRNHAKPGVSGESVDAAARAVIENAGYGEFFVHRTGHGIGLSTHEPPYIVKGNTAPLKPGMCFSVEPGIYLPGRFGVRIENIVTCTEDGCRSLDAEPSPTLRVVHG